ncbi:Predicted membrane metal-binding protein [Rhodospirillaceae bacterium LM-1]|nr:Predicted membrane metal-binding protein [Rhodospirillaceae bacterium LM-1]
MSLEGDCTSSTPSKWEALNVAARRGWELVLQPFLAERERWPLWLPVLCGIGIAVYFASAVEIGLPALIIAFLAVVSLAFGLRKNTNALIPLMVVGALLAGFGAASIRSQIVAAPLLERPLSMALVSGLVAHVEPLEQDGARVILERLSFENRTLQSVPQRIRLRLPPKSPTIVPGDRIRLYASLMPPTGPVIPGGFDFARQAWFQKLGAIGYGMGQVEILDGTDADVDAGFVDGLAKSIARLRLHITKRIQTELPGDSGAVASALITGGERAISKPLLEAYRDSGLAHLLSVSGLHMSLVAGLVFVGLRALLALIGPLALNYPIKKWTAVGAALATLFYLFLSGAFVPTQRSFLMTGIVLLGVVLDRQAISMRLVAWAALAILLTQPESLTGASFQMSFAAVLALVAVYEIAQAPVSDWRRQKGGWWRGVILYVALLALSSLVASFATAPFSAHHFNRFNPYGLASNMLAVPLSGMLVMPAALASVLLMPLGLERLALIPMGWGVDMINAIAYETASWPGAGLAVPSFSPSGFAALVGGGLWLLLMRKAWRYLGVLGICFGISTAIFARLPDLLVDGGNGLAAIRLEDGRVLMTPGKQEPITRQAWQRYLAIDGEAEVIADGAAGGRVRCDSLGCRLSLKDVALALTYRPEALPEDCASADLLLAPFSLPKGACQRPTVIDRRQGLGKGPHAIWLEQGKILRIETVKEKRGHHPWAPEKRKRTKPDEEYPETKNAPERQDLEMDAESFAKPNR